MNFKQKYLKYKQKYIILKNQTGGETWLENGFVMVSGDTIKEYLISKGIKNFNDRIPSTILDSSLTLRRLDLSTWFDIILRKWVEYDYNNLKSNLEEYFNSNSLDTPTSVPISTVPISTVPTSTVPTSTVPTSSSSKFIIPPIKITYNINHWVDKYNLGNGGRIDKSKTPLEINGIFFELNGDYFNFYAIYYGNYDDDGIQYGLKSINDKDLNRIKRLPGLPSLKENFDERNVERKKNEPKYLILGFIKGEIKKENIFIDSFEAGFTPRGGGNNLLCLLIDYLKNHSKLYKSDTILNIELNNRPAENFDAYKKMGFEKCNNNCHFSTYSASLKLNINKFNSQCTKFNNLVKIIT